MYQGVEASNEEFTSTFPIGSYGYYWELSQHLPDTLEAPIFATFRNASVPNGLEIPGPIDYPRGIIYAVQVGAFRNNLPMSFYYQFAPVVSEEHGDGIHRYTAGFFNTYKEAYGSLKLIKELGYKDAFVVVLNNGKRVKMTEDLKRK
jgi:hypothetical protein